MKNGRYLVFGATGGIGSCLCEILVSQQHQVFGAGRDAVKLQKLLDNGCVGSVSVDATDWVAVQNAIQMSIESMGGLDGVAVCIGSLLLKPAHLTLQEEWRGIMETHVTTSFGILGASAKAMMRGGGSIVLTGSAAGRIGMANHEAVAAAKGAIMGLTLSAAATYAPRGIRINCVAPGLVETPMTQGLFANEASRNASRQMHALGRLGQANDVAETMAWLLSSKSSWVTGQVIGVDGGLGSLLPRARASS
ncbi:MAG: SDR family oxidoreductase [Verrucomicrobiota bacterium]